jgi:hypothetical protein
VDNLPTRRVDADAADGVGEPDTTTGFHDDRVQAPARRCPTAADGVSNASTASAGPLRDATRLMGGHP